VVHDTETDERWLPLKDQPYAVGSALAVPIARGQDLFGILTLLHSRKNHFNEGLISAMQGTADQIALVLDNVRLYVELAQAKAAAEVYSKALDQELEKGRKIQRDFLPAALPRVPHLDIAAQFTPALQVSGDFYDVFTLPENHVGLVVGDVSDKGVGAALYMALIRSFIRMFARQCCREALHPSAPFPSGCGIRNDLQGSALMALTITNDYLVREHHAEGMFATLFLGILQSKTGSLRYVNAGHLPIYTSTRFGEVSRLAATGPAVGLQENTTYRNEEVRLPPESLVFG
jgi:sigma-B regulation protein RsbU (phosphoserine phosphatase)